MIHNGIQWFVILNLVCCCNAFVAHSVLVTPRLQPAEVERVDKEQRTERKKR